MKCDPWISLGKTVMLSNKCQKFECNYLHMSNHRPHSSLIVKLQPARYTLKNTHKEPLSCCSWQKLHHQTFSLGMLNPVAFHYYLHFGMKSVELFNLNVLRAFVSENKIPFTVNILWYTTRILHVACVQPWCVPYTAQQCAHLLKHPIALICCA